MHSGRIRIRLHSIFWWLYKVFIFLLMLVSFHAWMFWKWNANVYFWIIAFFISIVFYAINHKHYYNRRRHYLLRWFLLLQISLIVSAIGLNINGILTVIIPSWALFSVIMLNDESKRDLFDTIFIFISVALLVSVSAWILFIVGIRFPYEMVSYGVDDLYYFMNYRFFLINTTMGDSLSSFVRFCSIFLEPGYLGCMISLLLFARKFKMDFWAGILLLVEFLTFSLAGWLILLICYIVYKGLSSKRFIVTLIVGLTVFIGIWIVAKNYNGGNNLVYSAFFERLEFDSDTNTISGYDRSTAETDEWFWKTFIKSPDIIFGAPSAADVLKINDNDWKAYIVSHGLVGFSLFLIFVFYPFLVTSKKAKERRKMLFFLGVSFFLIFAQTIHLIFSIMYLTIFVLGESLFVTDYRIGSPAKEPKRISSSISI